MHCARTATSCIPSKGPSTTRSSGTPSGWPARPHADRDGLLDTLPIEQAGDRSWNYVTLGLGHPRGATFWADFVYTLRSVGYDGTLNIEHEDTLVNSVEGVGRAASLLKQIVLVEQPDWKPANI